MNNEKIKINEEYSFTTTNQDGQEVKCDTLAIVNRDDAEPIIIYTDYTYDENEKFKVYVSEIVANGEGYYLQMIKDYENIPEIKKALDKVWNEIN